MVINFKAVGCNDVFDRFYLLFGKTGSSEKDIIVVIVDCEGASFQV